MNEMTKDYLYTAENDKITYEYLNTMVVKKQYQNICYHCQQCVEKSLKAVIVEFNCCDKPPRTHDVNILLDVVSRYCTVPQEFYRYGAVLTSYVADVRYKKMEYIDESHSLAAMRCAEEIYEWVMQLLQVEVNR